MSPQPATPWGVYREYVHPLRLHSLGGLIQHRALTPLAYGEALWSIFFVPHRHEPSLISIVGTLFLPTVTGGSDSVMSVIFTEEDSTFYSLRGFRWDRGCLAPTFLSPSNL